MHLWRTQAWLQLSWRCEGGPPEPLLHLCRCTPLTPEHTRQSCQHQLRSRDWPGPIAPLRSAPAADAAAAAATPAAWGWGGYRSLDRGRPLRQRLSLQASEEAVQRPHESVHRRRRRRRRPPRHSQLPRHTLQLPCSAPHTPSQTRMCTQEEQRHAISVHAPHAGTAVNSCLGCIAMRCCTPPVCADGHPPG